MKVLVLGKNGMLGHVVYNYLKEKGYTTIGTSSKDNNDILYDAYLNLEHIEDIIKDEKPEAVVNCIGILNKVCEDNKELAVKLNSLLPHYLDNLSRKYNFKFIHISTDCVYEGTKGKYIETDLPDASSFYGRSKALGEVINDNSLTLRTSIVGPDENPNGIGLFQWFMNQENETGGYTKVIWTGVTTIELAKCIEIALRKKVVGLNHVVNNDFISKYELLKLFKKYFGKEIEIKKNDKIVSEKTLVRTDKSYDFNVPSYDEMISDMALWVQEHEDLYKTLIKKSNFKRR